MRLKQLIYIFFLFSACVGCGFRETRTEPHFPLDKWERHEYPVLDGFLTAYQPCVREVNDEIYPYRMWFFGWMTEVCNPEYPGCDAIFIARSKNLEEWEVFCKDGAWDNKKQVQNWVPVIFSNTNEVQYFFDSWHTGDPSVVIKDGIYYMAYSATSKDFGGKKIQGYPSDMILCVMGATSMDGIHWQKTEKPLLIAEMDTIFPPLPQGKRIGDFHRPSLLWDAGNQKWKLYFDYYNYSIEGNHHVSLAENDGDFRTGKFVFVNDLNKPLILNWPNPEVFIIDDIYYSVSDGPGYPKKCWESRQISFAQSADGKNWEKKYIIPPDSGIEANQVPQAFICENDGKQWLYIFYATQIGWRTDLHNNYYFIRKGDYNWNYDQIRYMRQEVKTLKNR